MTPLDRAAYLAHARTGAFSRRVERSRQVVRDWLATTSRRYVAFSGGKDSTAMLGLVREVDPTSLAVFGNDEFVLPETLALLDATPNLHRIAARIEHAPWFTAWDQGAEGLPAGTEWVEPDGQGPGPWARLHGYDGAAVGIRAGENNYRRLHIRARGELFYARRRQVWQCYPLAWWTTQDVWAYILSRKLDYNRAYDRLAEIGVEPDRQRIGPFAQAKALAFGQLALLKAGWPADFERFALAHPEARREL